MRTGIQQLRAEIHSEARRTMKDIQIGGDTFNFEMVVDGADEGAYLDETPLKNSSGKEFGAVEVEKGKIHLRISLPKFVREDNVMPFSVTDIIMLELLRNDVEQALNRVLKGIVGDETDAMAATATSIECNITRRVAGNSTCSHVLNLINRSFYEGTNVVYQRASAKCKYDKENETLIIRKRNYYVLKCYDKSLEQRKSGNMDVVNGLLRIEVVMQDRIIEKLFMGKSTVRDVLTRQGLVKIIEEYKRIFLEDVIYGHIIPCLTEVRDILYVSLVETDSQVEMIALRKELIMDDELLRKALTKWYICKGYGEERAKRNTDTYICRNRGKYQFPQNAIDTVREFAKLCK